MITTSTDKVEFSLYYSLTSLINLELPAGEDFEGALSLKNIDFGVYVSPTKLKQFCPSQRYPAHVPSNLVRSFETLIVWVLFFK